MCLTVDDGCVEEEDIDRRYRWCQQLCVNDVFVFKIFIENIFKQIKKIFLKNP
jgi:hypothetical protein